MLRVLLQLVVLVEVVRGIPYLLVLEQQIKVVLEVLAAPLVLITVAVVAVEHLVSAQMVLAVAVVLGVLVFRL